MPKSLKYLLPIALFADFLISLGFGLVSWFLPLETFGTIVAIPEANQDLVLAMFSSLSIFYVLIALVCLMGVKLGSPANIWIAAIMILRHGWIGIQGVLDINQEWLIGDPYPDIVIHTVFVMLYLLGFGIIYRKEKKELSRPADQA